MSKRKRSQSGVVETPPKKKRIESDVESELDAEEFQYKGQRNDNGEFHGEGELELPGLGVKYTGSFKDGVKHGNGKLTFDDGSSLQGPFDDDCLCGPGIYTTSEGV